MGKCEGRVGRVWELQDAGMQRCFNDGGGLYMNDQCPAFRIRLLYGLSNYWHIKPPAMKPETPKQSRRGE